jgi:uncharacterized protein (DUF427 family)
MRAIWNGAVIAESEDTVVLEGNHYFPPGAVDQELLEASEHTTRCPWKGLASYYHVRVDGERNDNAAWFYRDPSPAASEIRDHVAFWKGVEIVE